MLITDRFQGGDTEVIFGARHILPNGEVRGNIDASISSAMLYNEALSNDQIKALYDNHVYERGLERLNLLPKVVTPSDNLWWKRSKGAIRYQNHWILKERGGFIEFCYDMDKVDEITISFKLNNYGEKSPCSIYFNDQQIEAGYYKPGDKSTYNKSWFVPKNLTKKGINIIKIMLNNNADSVMFVKGFSVGDFEMETQVQSQWCWDASGISVVNYLKRGFNRWKQCTLYDKIKGTNGACNYSYRELPSSGNPLNQPGIPHNVYNTCQVYNGVQGSAADWDQLIDNMDKLLPVTCGVYWKGGGGHAVVISSSYEKDRIKYVVVDDPWTGSRRTLTYEAFKNSYHQLGDRWKYTAWVKEV